MALSNVELHILITRELKDILDGSWFLNIQNIDTDAFKIRFRKHGNRKYDLIIKLPEALFITSYEHEIPPQQPSGLCMYVRKVLENSVLKAISQHNFDRVVTLEFSNGFKLILEFFSTGNFIVVDSEGKVKYALRYESWRDREIKPNKVYKYPLSRGMNPVEITEGEFAKIFMKQDAIRSLVASLNMSNTYLEEVCALASVNKNETSPSPEKQRALFNALKTILLETPIKPGIQYEEVTTSWRPVPFKLATLGSEFRQASSFNEALDDFYSSTTMAKKGEKPEAIRERSGLSRLEHRFEEQEKALAELETQITENKKSGDAIYANFHALNELMERIKTLRKQGASWDEINEKIASADAKVNFQSGKLIINAE